MLSEEQKKSFEAIPVDRSQWGDFVNWALDYFHIQENCPHPCLNFCIELDHKNARSVYEEHYKNDQSSFTAYLYYKLIQSLKQHPMFQWRDLDGTWHELKNPPVFMPIRLDVKHRFHKAVIFDTFQQNWTDFVKNYRNTIEKSLEKKSRPSTASTDDTGLFYNCIFLGNLPQTKFTTFSLNHFRVETGRPIFYFGKRENDKCPLAITLDHANLDPFMLDLLLETYEKELVKVE